MSAIDLDGAGPDLGPDPPVPPTPELDQWRQTSDGRFYVPRTDGVSGIIYRWDEHETVAQGRARMALPRDQRPRRKRERRPNVPKLPDEQAKKPDLKELEKELAEALKAPAIVCAAVGDEWSAEHFTRAGPYLARNLVLASEHNPWLRQKLEQAATGEDAMMMVVSLVSVGGAVVTYTLPPVVYWLNVPVSNKMREMFGIPDRRKPPRQPDYAATETAPSAEPPPVPVAA